MRALRSWFPALLLLCAAPSFGQGTSFFQVCNAGKIAVDAYMAIQGEVVTKHVGPADCEFLLKGTGGFAAGTLGFAFPDAKGQWRGARRGGLLPFWEADLGGNNFSAVKRTQAVQHDGANFTIPMIVAFGAKTPTCSQPVRTSARASLPLNATTTQRIMAEQADQRAAANSAPICSSVGYQLTVTPYADSGEIGYDTQCDPCTAKQIASMTPEEKAAEERRSTLIESQVVALAAMPGVGGLMMRNVVQGVDQQQKEDEQNEKDRAEIAKGPWAMTWQQYPNFVTSAFGPRDTKPLIANRHIVMRGTISRLQLPNPGAQIPWIHVYFKDSATITKPEGNLPGDYFINDWLRAGQPEGAFAICELGPDVFPEVFGADWATAMVGKTVEFEGELNRGTCATAAGIRIVLARQLKVVTPNMTASVARPWDVSMAPPRPTGGVVTPPPAQPPTPGSRTAATRAAAIPGATKAPEKVAAAASTPPPAAPITGVSVRTPAPAPTPAAPAKPAASPVVENAIALLRAKVQQYRILDQVHRSNQPHTLTGDERSRLEDAGASERLLEAIEKPADIKLEEMQPQRASPADRQALIACQRKAALDYPRDIEARIKAIAACTAH